MNGWFIVITLPDGTEYGCVKRKSEFGIAKFSPSGILKNGLIWKTYEEAVVSSQLLAMNIEKKNLFQEFEITIEKTRTTQ